MWLVDDVNENRILDPACRRRRKLVVWLQPAVDVTCR